MNPLSIIEQFYDPGSELYKILVHHSRIVAARSLKLAESLKKRGTPYADLDLEFIENAAMLHDIGIVLTRADKIGCRGEYPYVCHGYLGRKLLDEEGLPSEYGLVCERHTGAGISLENITKNRLPLPARDMIPQSLEEKIICIADKYHSKDSGNKIITIAGIIEKLKKIDPEHSVRFAGWAEQFRLQDDD